MIGKSTTGAAFLLAAAVLAATSASATTIADPAGDFLGTYTGPQNSDLDVLSWSATYTPEFLLLSSTLGGAVGTTAGSLFLFGVNRGSGTDRLISSGPPPVGPPSILLDAIVRFDAAGGGRVVLFPAMGAPVTTLLDPSMITIFGDTISGRIPISLLPSTGFAFADYTYIHWSRSIVGSQDFIADLAPHDRSIVASAVPEPAAWAMMIGGFGIAVAARRRRKGVAAAA